MAGLFILYLNRNIPQFLIGIGGTLREVIDRQDEIGNFLVWSP
jgi:hypothetical protein